MKVQGMLKKTADVHSDNSISNRLRTKRFVYISSVLNRCQPPVRVLDIGGTPEFWRRRLGSEASSYEITIVNRSVGTTDCPGISQVVGDARDLSEFGDYSFDVVVSNSTIEHLYSVADQELMACEVRRLAPHYVVQTPNVWFPFEPHFLMPGWQWLPRRLRVAVIRRRRVGHRERATDHLSAMRSVAEIELLSRTDLQALFPDGELVPERLGCFVKSWTVIR